MPSALSSTLLLLALFNTSHACLWVTPGTPGASSISCKSCAQTLITKSQTGQGSHSFATDMTSTTEVCAVRIFTCKGLMANIEINVQGGSISDGGTGMAIFEVTCNVDGTAWMAQGMVITNVECSSLSSSSVLFTPHTIICGFERLLV